MSMKLIEHRTVGPSGIGAIEFTDIPQTYTDLYLLMSLDGNRTPAVGDNLYISFNGSTANFSTLFFYGSGSSVGSITETNLLVAAASGSVTANTFSNSALHIRNYTSSNNKTFTLDALFENNATESYLVFQPGVWSNTQAISSIGLDLQFGSLLVEHSSVTLYGITAGSDGTTTVS
jgi:hypothetical protein